MYPNCLRFQGCPSGCVLIHFDSIPLSWSTQSSEAKKPDPAGTVPILKENEIGAEAQRAMSLYIARMPLLPPIYSTVIRNSRVTQP